MRDAHVGYGNLAGSVLGVVAFLWFGWAQTGWFAARLGLSRRAAIVWEIAAILAAVLTGGITLLIAGSI